MVKRAVLLGTALLSTSVLHAKCVNTLGMTDAQLRAHQDDACGATENITTAGDMAHLRPVSLAFRTAVEQAVRENLKDPESARFKFGPTLHLTGLYCGMVNSKNGFGGYSGFQTFAVYVSQTKGTVKVSFGDLGSEASLLCGAAGY